MILGKIVKELTSDETKGPNTGPPSTGFADGDAYVDRGSADDNGLSAEERAAASSESSGSIAADTLAKISRDDLKNYLDTYGGMEEELLGDTDSRAMIDSAKSSQVLGQQVSSGMQQRALSRYGASMTGAQQASHQRMSSLGNAASYTGAVNNSVLDQRDRNLGLKSGLTSMGKEQLSVALGGLSSAAGMESGREAQYQRDRAASHAMNMQALGAVIGYKYF